MNIQISDIPIGTNNPPFLIAEIGMNHNGNIELAKEMVRSAAKTGADAVKFQTFRTDRFLAPSYEGREKYREYELSQADHATLKEEAASNDVIFLSTPLDRDSVNLLNEIGVPAFKIASSDLTNLPFLEYVAEIGKPMILSTGYATLSEVAKAVEAVTESGNDELVLLQCVSNYPAETENMNLRTIKTMRETFDVPTGLSDHTQGPVAAITATGFGAAVVEKHFTTDNELPGFDHEMSENPDSFSRLVDGVHSSYAALGSGKKQPLPSEFDNRTRARRSLYWDGTFESGTEVKSEMMVELRPGNGVAPSNLEKFVGSTLSTDVEPYSPVQYSDVTWL